MKIYISGAITDVPKEEYTKFFADAELELRRIGITDIVNPLTFGITDEMPWDDAMKICIQRLQPCDGIYMLRNWQNSRGARKELVNALENGKKAYFEYTAGIHNLYRHLTNQVLTNKYKENANTSVNP